MTSRVIVTDVAALGDVLDRIDVVAAPRGWRVRRPDDAAELEARARSAKAALRLPSPVVVEIEHDPDAAAVDDPIDATALLARTPVAGAVVDGARRLHGA